MQDYDHLAVECYMETSDMDSGRSDTVFVRRPGSGRRKATNPWRSPWDASVCTVYTTSSSAATSAPRAAEPAVPRPCLTPSSRSPIIVVHQHKQPVVRAAQAAAQHLAAQQGAQQGARKKGKQELCGPCCHCGATTSPQWRKGPKGKPILCNACGIRFLRTRSLGKVQQPRKRRMGGSGLGADDDYMPPMSTTGKRVKREADESASDDTLLAVKQEATGSDATSSPSLSASGAAAGAGGNSSMEVASSTDLDEALMAQMQLAAQLHPALQQILAAHGLVTADQQQQVFAIQRSRSNKAPAQRALPLAF